MTHSYTIRVMLPQVYARLVNKNIILRCEVCNKDIKVKDKYVPKTKRNSVGKYSIYCLPYAKEKNLI